MPEYPLKKVRLHPSKQPPAPGAEPVSTLRAEGPAFAELSCISNFSFLRGASHPDELVQQAELLGYDAIALGDENTLAGVVRAHVAAREARVHFIVGASSCHITSTWAAFTVDG